MNTIDVANTKQPIPTNDVELTDLMLSSLNELRTHLIEQKDEEGGRIFNEFAGYTGIYIDNLYELHEQIMALREEIAIKKEANKEGLKKELREDFEEMVTHLVDNEDQEGFETLVRIKKGANVLIENLIRKEEDVFERWQID